jgi:formamidopyrimidine-DNA glycosylase
VPELPDVTIYIERLRAFTVGRTLDDIRIASPFVLRSVDPPVAELRGQEVEEVGRIGKRLVLSLGDDVHAVIHLTIGAP